jgi:ribosomal protein L31
MNGNKLKLVSLIILVFITQIFIVINSSKYSHSLNYQNTDISQNLPEEIEVSALLKGWTKTELIFNESTTASLSPKIALDDAGNVHLVWYDHTDYKGAGTDPDIFYRLWNATTDSWEPIEVVSFEHNGTSYTPSIAVDKGGHLHLAWTDSTNYKGAGGDYDIFYKRWNATTSIWSPTEVVSNTSSDWSQSNAIAVDIDGNAYIVWDDRSNYSGAGSDYDIFYRCWNATSANWTLVQVVSSESGGESYNPSVAVDSNGTVHVVWRESAGIYYKYWNLTALTWNTVELVSTESQGIVILPEIAVDGTGHVHVVWKEESAYGNSGSDDDIMYKRWNATTGNWTTTEVVSTESSEFSGYPSFAVDNDGNSHIAWKDQTDLDGAGPESDIFYKLWNATTGIWSQVEVISTESTYYSSRPSIAVDVAGYVHIAWEDETDYQGAGTDEDIFYKRTIDVPQAPLLHCILPNPDGDGVIELNWSDIINATLYYIYRDTLSITNINGLTPLSVVLTSNYTDNITQNGIYYYVVIAETSLINSSLSNCENVTVAIPIAPPAFDPIDPNPDEDGLIQLNWNTSLGATIYYIYRSTSVIISVAGLSPFNATSTTSWTDTLLTNGTYYYVILASDFIINSSLSNCENVTVEILPPEPGKPPNTPHLDSIVPNPNRDGVIQLNWSEVVGASTYYVYRATSNITSVHGMSPIQTIFSNSCLDTITSDGLYYYVVVAGNASGNSTPSNCESVQVAIFRIPGFGINWGFLGILTLVIIIRYIPTRKRESNILPSPNIYFFRNH